MTIFNFFYINIFKQSIKLLKTSIFLISIGYIGNASASCYNFIPYAHNSLYTHLPKNKEFCVKINNEIIKFKTSKYNSRIIYNNNEDENHYFAFGDSQLLGIDWHEMKTVNHDLEGILNSNFISIFASPNNGPLQALAQAKDLFKKKSFKNIKNLIFSFNFGNDIFRIQKNWNLNDFVPLESKDLETIMLNPILYDLIILKGVLSGKYFSTNLPDNKQTYLLYHKLSRGSVKTSIDKWLEKIKEFKLNKKFNFKLIIYPPYWVYDKNGQIIFKDVYNDYLFFCSKMKNNKIFEDVYFGELHANQYLTKDNRHFKTNSLTFRKK